MPDDLDVATHRGLMEDTLAAQVSFAIGDAHRLSQGAIWDWHRGKLPGLFGTDTEAAGFYRMIGVPQIEGVPDRSSSRPHSDSIALEATLHTLTNEIAELREEVASLREIMTLPALSVSEQQQRHVELFEEFVRLAAQWQAETAGASVTRRIVSHPAYLRIIGMGDRAVPWILDQLENGEAHWFEALHAITGANPVPDEDRGVYAKMARAWLAWGRDNGWIV